MNLTEAARMAVGLLNHHALSFVEFRFNNRHVRVGTCYFLQERPVRIELSRSHVLLNSPQAVRETLLHEIAHALTGRRHNATWRDKCIELGCPPKRTCACRGLWKRWMARCPGCQYVYARSRSPAEMGQWYCRTCGSQKGLLTWRDLKCIGTSFSNVTRKTD